MSHTERSTKIPSPRTGFFAMLRAFLRGSGTGAPSVASSSRATCAARAHSAAGGTPGRTAAAVPAFVAVLALVLLAPAPSLASFTRPFLRQITGTPGGPFSRPGIAVGAGDDLWVVEPVGRKNPLDQFESVEHGNAFLKTLEIESPEEFVTEPANLAIDESTGSFYTTGSEETNFAGESFGSTYVEMFNESGAFVKRVGPFVSENGADVAVENETGLVYVVREGGIDKFNAELDPESFEGCATCSTYVAGNEIDGTPSGPSFPRGSVAFDAAGDIYSASNGGQPIIAEYKPSGELAREFTGAETPGLGEHHEGGGWGSQRLGSIAVDPASGHLLVVVDGEWGGEAAIDEFDLETGRFVAQITEASLGHPLHAQTSVEPIAIAADSKGDIYFDEQDEHAVYVLGPGRFDPTVRLAEATQRTPSSVLLGGSVDPEALSLAACNLEYVSEAVFEENLAKTGEGFSDLATGGSRPCAPAVPVDSSFHAVHAEVTGLSSGTTYRYRLSATTSGALGGTAVTAPAAFTAPAKPRIDSTAAENLSSTFADLDARIDPLGADTVYHFEYISEAAYLANGGSWVGLESPTSVPAAPAGIGSGGADGSVDASVVQRVGGLQPSTVYRFRVVAGNEVGTTEGEAGEGGAEVAHTFATYPGASSGLPDGRAYELVTPPDKGSAGDMFGHAPNAGGEFVNHDVGYPSESGDQFLLETSAAFGPFPASGRDAYVFSRTSNGWEYTSLASPALGVQSVEVAAFDPSDLSRVGLRDLVGSADSTVGASYVSLLGSAGGLYTALHSNPARRLLGQEEDETEIVGGSHDLGDVVLESTDHMLAPGAEEQDVGSSALYESTGGGECIQGAEECTLINVNGEGSLLSRCGAVLGLGTRSLGGHFEPGFSIGPGGPVDGKTHNAVSADGSRVFFTAPNPDMSSSLGGPGGRGCWNGATTDAPQLYVRSGGDTTEVSAPEEGAPEAGGRYIAQYVGASEDGSRVFFVTEAELTKSDEGIHDLELYEYDIEKPIGERLTRVSAGEPGSPAATAGAVVYAVPAVSADGSAVYFLARGQLTAGHPAAPGGEVNLYQYDTATAATVYVATVTEGAWGFPFDPEQGDYGVGLNPQEPWYTTPDGRYLLYADNGELYRYQAPIAGVPAGEVLCVSCNPSGAAPVSRAEFVRSAPEQDNYAGGPVVGMSDDGSYVFFDSADALVPQATNGTLDVYEWHDDRISLLSPGSDATPSYFLGASTDGSNVFFGTHARLVPSDQDTAGNIYDARICTESEPCIKPPAGETAQCEGDACQSAPAEPIDATPASLTFSGPGDVAGEVAPPAAVKAKAKSAVQIRAAKLVSCA